MSSHRKLKIERRFADSHQAYDRGAHIQRLVAAKLADRLPDLVAPRVLEIGCGTGFLTRELFQKYSDGTFDITDISSTMTDWCRDHVPNPSARFFAMDGEHPKGNAAEYDLIVSSMAVQWFEKVGESFARLAQLGPLYYATIGPKTFKEWRACMEMTGQSDGLLDVPDWPGVVREEILKEKHAGGLAFLRSLRDTGVNVPKAGYQPLSALQMRKVLDRFDSLKIDEVSWHIIFGRIEQSMDARLSF